MYHFSRLSRDTLLGDSPLDLTTTPNYRPRTSIFDSSYGRLPTHLVCDLYTCYCSKEDRLFLALTLAPHRYAVLSKCAPECRQMLQRRRQCLTK
ncbi:hypothetical protein J6590_098214 [Homalodisca vitripennis]|nr:hypothetical protein J6590_098214 [Homalodisca vitripennis]